MNGAAGLEAVGMGGDAAHGVHRDGAAHHFLVIAAQVIRPGNIKRNLFLEGRAGKLGSNAADRFCRNAAAVRDILGRPFVLNEALGDEGEGGDHAAAVRQFVSAHQLRCGIGRQRWHR